MKPLILVTICLAAVAAARELPAGAHQGVSDPSPGKKIVLITGVDVLRKPS